MGLRGMIFRSISLLRKRSFVAHDLLALDLDDLTAIADFFKSASSMPGFSCELHAVDQGEFALIVGIG
jgi:hypothetical protein